jgi:polyribonucleotide nucleotidyltransferase
MTNSPDKLIILQTQLADLREALRTTSTAIDELEAALRKVKLASKLGCTASELKRLTVNVPPDKIGRVIGKQGVTIKQIESKSKVTMDVDSISGKIHLTGSEAQLNIAIAEIDKIVMAIDEDVVVSSHVYQYLANKVRYVSR